MALRCRAAQRADRKYFVDGSTRWSVGVQSGVGARRRLVVIHIDGKKDGLNAY